MDMTNPASPNHQMWTEAVRGDAREMLAELREQTNGDPRNLSTDLFNSAMVDWFGPEDAFSPIVRRIVAQVTITMMMEESGVICLN